VKLVKDLDELQVLLITKTRSLAHIVYVRVLENRVYNGDFILKVLGLGPRWLAMT